MKLNESTPKWVWRSRYLLIASCVKLIAILNSFTRLLNPLRWLSKTYQRQQREIEFWKERALNINTEEFYATATGETRFTLTNPFFAVLARSVADLMRANPKAKNFLTMTFLDPKDGEKFIMTVRRATGETVEEVYGKLKTKYDELIKTRDEQEQAIPEA
jgi:hypothetical protein